MKYASKIEAKKAQLQKLKEEYENLVRLEQEEIKKNKEKQIKQLGGSLLKYINSELNRDIYENEPDRIINFLREHQYF